MTQFEKSDNKLLDTIRVPLDLKNLKNRLPRATYKF